ncbi:MAG: hypothetical protein AABM33_13505 [Pseudomonadota bacterium]
MLRFVALFVGSLGCAIALHAQTPAKPAPADKKAAPVVAPPSQPKGVYATINLVPMVEVNRRLETSGQRNAAAREVLKNPTAYMPPVLYAVANVLSGDRPEEAIFWYHVGRVRAVYDAFRCKDNSARNIIPELGKKLSAELIRSQYYQRDHLAGIAKKAIDWDAQNPRNYDQRWICLYGRVAQASPGTDPAEVQKPESEWPAILKHIHEAHLKSVQEFAAQPAPTR